MLCLTCYFSLAAHGNSTNHQRDPPGGADACIPRHTALLEAAATLPHASHLSTHLRSTFFVFLICPSFFLILYLRDELSLCFAAQALPASPLSPLCLTLCF